MILALVKKPLLKAQLKNYFDEISFYDSPIELAQDIHKHPEIALIIENTGFEISGFLFSAIIDNLIPDRVFHIYLVTNDTSKSFLVNKTFHNIHTVSYNNINGLLNEIVFDKSTTVKIDHELFYDTFEKIFITEKIKTFIMDYSSLVLENIYEPNIWFMEYFELIKLITGFDKIIIKITHDDKHIIFSSINNFREYHILMNEISRDLNDSILITPDNFYQIENEDSFVKYNIESFNEKIGEIIFLFYKSAFSEDFLKSVLKFLLNPIKIFKWYNSYQYLKNRVESKNNITRIFSNILKNLGKNMPMAKHIAIVAEKSTWLSLKAQNDIYYIITTSPAEICSILYIHLNNLLSEGEKEFKDIIYSLNSFIHKNILHLYPMPLGILKVDEDKITFSATEGIIGLYKSATSKKIIETGMQYFGTYDIINPVIKEFSYDDETKIQILPDLFFCTFKEREKIINDFLKG